MTDSAALKLKPQNWENLRHYQLSGPPECSMHQLRFALRLNLGSHWGAHDAIPGL